MNKGIYIEDPSTGEMIPLSEFLNDGEILTVFDKSDNMLKTVAEYLEEHKKENDINEI